MGVGDAWAYSDVVSSWTEPVQVVHVKTVSDCKAKKGRGDEMVLHGNGALHARRGFIAVRGCASDIGGMVGGGVIREDFLPHSLFGWGIVIREGMPVVRSLSYLWPIVRSIGYLHLSTPYLCLVL